MVGGGFVTDDSQGVCGGWSAGVSSRTIRKGRGTHGVHPGIDCRRPQGSASALLITPPAYNVDMTCIAQPQLTHRPCSWCAAEFVIARRPGRPRLYCNHACRQRAYEHRHGFEHQRTVRPLPGQVIGVCLVGHRLRAWRFDRSVWQDPRAANERAPGGSSARDPVRPTCSTGERPPLQSAAPSRLPCVHRRHGLEPTEIWHQLIERAIPASIASRRCDRETGTAGRGGQLDSSELSVIGAGATTS